MSGHCHCLHFPSNLASVNLNSLPSTIAPLTFSPPRNFINYLLFATGFFFICTETCPPFTFAMASSPAHSVGSSMLIDDNPTIRLEGFADGGHEPILIDNVPLPALALKSVIPTKQVIAFHSESVGELRPIRAHEEISKFSPSCFAPCH